MIAAGGGSIIDLTSVASRMPATGSCPTAGRSGVLPGYGGSKAALEHLTQCAAFDLADHNIAVNALSPSKPILTPGLCVYAREFVETAPAEEFARAAVELTLVDPGKVTGRAQSAIRSSTAASAQQINCQAGCRSTIATLLARCGGCSIRCTRHIRHTGLLFEGQSWCPPRRDTSFAEAHDHLPTGQLDRGGPAPLAFGYGARFAQSPNGAPMTSPRGGSLP